MSTLAEIEAAADALPIEQKEALLHFLAERLQRKPESQTGDTQRPSAQGAAADWLRTAKGSVRVAPGQTADDLRMEFYAAKYDVKP
jgi:hypothetical protein